MRAARVARALTQLGLDGQEATRLVESARAEIQQDIRRARAELRAEMGGLAVEIAERIIQRSLRGEDHERLVQDALARLDSR